MKNMQFYLNFNVSYDEDRRFEEIERFEESHYVIRPDENHLIIFESEKSAQRAMFDASSLQQMGDQELVETVYDVVAYWGQPKQEIIKQALKITREKHHTVVCSQGKLNSLINLTANRHDFKNKLHVVNADNIGYINREYIEQLYFAAPITATVDIYSRCEPLGEAQHVGKICLDEYLDDRYDINKRRVGRKLEKETYF